MSYPRKVQGDVRNVLLFGNVVTRDHATQDREGLIAVLRAIIDDDTELDLLDDDTLHRLVKLIHDTKNRLKRPRHDNEDDDARPRKRRREDVDRQFVDDMLYEVLRVLPLDELMRLRTTNKQFKRIIDTRIFQEITSVPDDIPVPMTDAILRMLTNVTDLDIGRHSMVTDDGLRHMSKLTVLSLEENRLITDDGLDHLHHLTDLDLKNNEIITDDGLDHLHHLTDLNLNDNDIITDAALAHLSHLEWLNISSNVKITNGGLGYLPQLTHLILAYNDMITDAGLQPMLQLRALHITDTRITDDGIRGLSALEQLAISGNRDVTGAGLRHLPILKSLDLRNNAMIVDADLRYLSTLESLDLELNTVITDAGLRFVPQLTSIDLTDNSTITTDGLRTLSRLRNVIGRPEYHIHNGDVMDVGMSVQNLPTVSRYDFHACLMNANFGNLEAKTREELIDFITTQLSLPPASPDHVSDEELRTMVKRLEVISGHLKRKRTAAVDPQGDEDVDGGDSPELPEDVIYEIYRHASFVDLRALAKTGLVGKAAAHRVLNERKRIHVTHISTEQWMHLLPLHTDRDGKKVGVATGTITNLNTFVRYMQYANTHHPATLRAIVEIITNLDVIKIGNTHSVLQPSITFPVNLDVSPEPIEMNIFTLFLNMIIRVQQREKMYRSIAMTSIVIDWGILSRASEYSMGHKSVAIGDDFLPRHSSNIRIMRLVMTAFYMYRSGRTATDILSDTAFIIANDEMLREHEWGRWRYTASANRIQLLKPVLKSRVFKALNIHAAFPFKIYEIADMPVSVFTLEPETEYADIADRMSDMAIVNTVWHMREYDLSLNLATREILLAMTYRSAFEIRTSAGITRFHEVVHVMPKWRRSVYDNIHTITFALRDMARADAVRASEIVDAIIKHQPPATLTSVRFVLTISAKLDARYPTISNAKILTPVVKILAQVDTLYLVNMTGFFIILPRTLDTLEDIVRDKQRTIRFYGQRGAALRRNRLESLRQMFEGVDGLDVYYNDASAFHYRAFKRHKNQDISRRIGVNAVDTKK